MVVEKRPREKYTQEQVDNYEITDYPTNHRFKDLKGDTFGKWRVLKYAGKGGGIHAKWFCICEGCSNNTIQKVFGHHLKKGVTTSCGCEHASILTEVMSNSFEDHQKHLKSFRDYWELLDYEKGYGSYSNYNFFCPKCNDTFKISYSGVNLKSGGCKCTMKGTNGFDYNQPAWFYIFKYTGVEENSYWKFGVTQKDAINSRDHRPNEGYKRELYLSEIIRDRWDTIEIERSFRRFFSSRGLSCTLKSDPLRNGFTECYPCSDITFEELEDFFWKLNPRIVPFKPDRLFHVEVNSDRSLSTGVIKYFNLNKKERAKWYRWLGNNNLVSREIDLTDPKTFDKISEFINIIRPEY